ncbi:MAG: HlyD family efflux transporter periplasmic adaptor subunit [Lysobacter sp.]|nr:HlyD family efflux transporter periplasmic adaptor subunit [Lysobacter sp.]
MSRYCLPAMLLACSLVGCTAEAPQALGTLEYDRISLPAPSVERIVSIEVREGDRVKAGAVVMTLERTRIAAQTDVVQAQAQQQRDALAEVEAGTRSEQVAQARARLAAAQAQARDARAYFARVQPLGQRRLIAAVEVDRARAAADSADANVRNAQASLEELENGARRERIAQAQSAVRAADAQVAAQAVTLDKLKIVAPRDGRIDSLPYKLGDQAPLGAPLAIMLVGDAPYARVYVPEPMRASVKIGDRATVHIDGKAGMSGHVRAIRSEPSFTPYYALSGKDAARLSYLAEIVLEGGDDLPPGLPVRVEFVAEK